ncbi:MAG: aromatic amino acid lyase [Deltaproteobacteria bacterium]|nr:aromatic amino acid lyase [Deltaproteobacteria bacterium]
MDANENSPGETRETRTIVFGRAPIRIEDVVALARGDAEAALDGDPGYRAKLKHSQQLLQELFEAGRDPIYGMSTGVGSSIGNAIPAELAGNLGLNLFRLHGVGTGRILDDEEAAAVVSARLPGLALGHSGVGAELLERLCLLLNERLLPRIPAEGSVGASGDLTPLSYVAAALAGEREVSFRSRSMPAAEAWREIRVDPLQLSARDTLAIMNGTSAMTGLACLAFDRAERLASLSAMVTAMVSDAIRGNPEHFSTRIFELKPHPGSIQAAAWIRDHLASGPDRAPARLQDRYSIRCAPHVIGVLLDTLETTRETLEIELNSANDNPLLDLENGTVLHGGNFHGAHVCAVMDSLKVAVASVADLLDRQLALLCVPETNGDLPENLVSGNGPESLVHHGFKAMQIAASALAAEALKLTLPAAAFSRSTESHNQDKVSMGTIAARDCLRILELSESVAAIGLLAAAQAVDLRGADASSSSSVAVRDAVRERVPMLDADRRQDVDIKQVLELHREGLLPCPSRSNGETAVT